MRILDARVTDTIAGDEGVADALRTRGLRLTEQRRIILDVVRATTAHPSAASVYRRVRRRLPRVSLATVYRNLRTLAAEGLIGERTDPSGARFDGNTGAHDHFTCMHCGRIFDVPALTTATVRQRVAGRTGFEVLDQRIEFYGRCRACRGRGTKTSRPTSGRRPLRSRRGDPPTSRLTRRTHAS